MSLLEISDLHTYFDTSAGQVKAVNAVDLTIEEGEILGLVGESGSGKTMLAMSMLRLVPAPGRVVSGKILFHGRNLLDLSEHEMREVRGGHIGVIFQDPMTSLNPLIRAGEQIAESIRLHQDVGESTSLWAESARKFVPFKYGKGDAWAKAVDMLRLVGIPDPERSARQYPHEFSGGMRQRVMIAIALSCNPDLLIADEPTTALDVTIQAEILRELQRLARRLETAVLLITHDLGIVSQVCDRVAIMYAGKVFELATAREVIDNPQNPYTLALMRSLPDLDTRKEHLEPIEGTVPDLIGWENGCLFSTRCPEALEECRRTDPELVRLPAEYTKLSRDHWCRCIRREPGGHDPAR
jgi:peptide/nickel transport system ATP-binding protein